MSDSLASFAALFRAVLILHDQEPPVSKADTVRCDSSSDRARRVTLRANL